MTRTFSPADFGVLSLGLSMAAIFAPFATMKFDSAVLLPTNRRETQSVATAGIIAAFCFGALLAGTLVLLPVPGVTGHLALLIPVLTVSTGWLMIMRQLNLRDKRFLTVAGNTILQSGSTSAAQLSSPFLNVSGSSGLVGGAMVGVLIPTGLMGYKSRQYIQWTSLREFGLAVRRFWRFPLVFAPSTALVLLAQQAPLLVIIWTYGVSTGGQMGVAERIVAIPVALLGLSIGQVFDAHLSERIREGAGGYLRVYIQTSAALSLLGLAVFLFFWFGSTWLLPSLLGDAWQQAGEFAKAMAVAAGMRMIVNPLRRYVVLFERATLSLWMDVGRIAVVLGVFALGHGSSIGPIGMAGMMFASLALVDVLTWLAGVQVTFSEDAKVKTVKS